MAKFDAHIAELLRRHGTDPNAAIELLSVATEYLKARQPMPDLLADYLAKAFRLAVATPEGEDGKPIERERVARLAFALGLTRSEGRPRSDVPKFDVALTVAQFGTNLSERELAKELADTYNVGTTTARSRIKEAKAKLADGRRILKLGDDG